MFLSSVVTLKCFLPWASKCHSTTQTSDRFSNKEIIVLLILSMADLKPEFRNGDVKPAYCHLNEAAERAAIYCNTVIIQDHTTGNEIILKDRD